VLAIPEKSPLIVRLFIKRRRVVGFTRRLLCIRLGAGESAKWRRDVPTHGRSVSYERGARCEVTEKEQGAVCDQFDCAGTDQRHMAGLVVSCRRFLTQ
jgi:hypothetical protein